MISYEVDNLALVLIIGLTNRIYHNFEMQNHAGAPRQKLEKSKRFTFIVHQNRFDEVHFIEKLGTYKINA